MRHRVRGGWGVLILLAAAAVCARDLLTMAATLNVVPVRCGSNVMPVKGELDEVARLNPSSSGPIFGRSSLKFCPET